MAGDLNVGLLWYCLVWRAGELLAGQRKGLNLHARTNSLIPPETSAHSTRPRLKAVETVRFHDERMREATLGPHSPAQKRSEPRGDIFGARRVFGASMLQITIVEHASHRGTIREMDYLKVARMAVEAGARGLASRRRRIGAAR